MKKRQLRREVGIFPGMQFREELDGIALGFDQNFPDFIDNFLQEVEVALFGRNDALPVPLIDIDTVVVVEEVIFPHGTHVSAESFALAHAEVAESGSLPYGGGLD